MLKILWKRGEIAPEEQFLLLFTIISYLILDFYVTTRIGFSLRDKQLFGITEVEITRVDCSRAKAGCAFSMFGMGRLFLGSIFGLFYFRPIYSFHLRSGGRVVDTR